MTATAGCATSSPTPRLRAGYVLRRGDFARTVEIATMCSWDTDCNAGNVGTILGVACGLEGLPAHYRDPINDEIVLSGISGYLNILDIPSYAWELARWGYRLRGEPVPEEVSGRVREGEVYFDFSLPGSTHGLCFACDVPTCARLRDGSVLLDRMVRGQKAKLFYKPFWRRADFSDERYMPVFSPRAYPGQQVEMRLRYEKLAGELLILTPYVRNSLSGAEISLSPTLLDASDEDVALRFVLPEVDGGLIDEIGVRIESAAPGKFALSGTLRPTLLHIWGPACYTLRPALLKKEFGSVIPFSHNHGAWDLEGGRLTLLCEEEAQAFTGNYFMRNCQLEAHITPRNGTQALVALRARARGADTMRAVRRRTRSHYGHARGRNAPAGADAAGLGAGPGIHASPTSPGRPADPDRGRENPGSHRRLPGLRHGGYAMFAHGPRRFWRPDHTRVHIR